MSFLGVDVGVCKRAPLLRNMIMQICSLLTNNCADVVLSEGFSVVITESSEETIQFQILLALLNP